jgi:hypothetical protein
MRLSATIAVLLFSIQATLCGLGGFGIVEQLVARAATTQSPTPEAASSSRGMSSDHCAGRARAPTPAEPASAPAEEPCRSHCQLYAQGIPSDAPQHPPLAAALHAAPELRALAAQPARTLVSRGPSATPPLARDLPILHAALLI